METNLSTNEMAKNAKKACLKIANVDTKTKNQLLLAISDRIKQSTSRIKECNEQDVQFARELLEKGELSKPLLNRLILTDDKIVQLSTYLEEVARLEDPVGKRQFAMKLANGLDLERVTCPLGLIAIIFESRPEVVIQVTALSLKSGNGVILKGGTEAANTNRVLFEIINEVLEEFDLSNTVNLIETRGDVAELLKQDTFVDLIIPRGSNSFVKYIQDNTRIPVLGHSSGICHIYIDSEYDSEMAIPVILDAKLDYPSACNAVETLLVNQNVAEQLIPEV
ncbi:MAG: glutamate-5-semialdehyde dehydrogenase, partial [Proteobacteria bacterium]|nr:glutamate-5-semialdehyde dehydrogenase [Pseudomonadota bacterium]